MLRRGQYHGEARLRAMIEASIDCVITIDAQSNILEFNAAAEKTFGYRRKEVIGKPLAETIIPPSLREAHRRGMAALLKGGSSKLLGRRVEMPAMRSNGSEFPVELTVTQIAGQNPPIFTAYLRDITDRIQAEEALNAQALRYKTLTQTSTDSIYVLNEKGDLQEANAAFLCQRGFAAEEAKGLNVADWDAQWSREQLQERLRNLVGGSAVFETRHRCKDGSVFDVEVCVTSVRIGGEQLFFCVTRDITERKQAEEALCESEQQMRLFMEATADSLWNWDLITGNVVRSVGFYRAFGYPAQEVDSGITWWEERLHSADRGRVLSTFQDTIAGGGNACSYEYRFRRKDGTYAVIHDHAYIVRDAKAKPLRALGAMTDITERKEAEEALHRANRQLQVLSRRLFEVQEEERRHLARELHDEIGQELTAAKINLQSVTDNGGSANIPRLQETTAILDRLLGQVRQISLDLRPSMLDDLGLVPALRSLLDQQGRRASVAVHFSAQNMPENLDPEIQTTCFRIAQEAITNAVGHANATQIDVDLRGENGELRFLIRDNGIGFDVASAQAQAVGLGLIGIRERAALVGGQAKIMSLPSKGTTIEVSLPSTVRPEWQGRHIRK